MFANFWRQRVRIPSGIRSGAPTKPDLGRSTVASHTAEAMARVQDPLVNDLTEALHRMLCGDIVMAGGDLNGRCPRFRIGSAHHDYYELRAEILLEKIGPYIGRGYVQGLVTIVINELDL